MSGWLVTPQLGRSILPAIDRSAYRFYSLADESCTHTSAAAARRDCPNVAFSITTRATSTVDICRRRSNDAVLKDRLPSSLCV